MDNNQSVWDKKDVEGSHKELYKLSKELIKALRQTQRQQRGKRFFWLLLIGLILAGIYAAGKYSGFTQPHAAIIDIKSEIAEGSPSGANYLLPALAQAFKSKKVTAIILDINSPGGSAVHSNRVFNTIRHYRTDYPDKKVFAVCSDVCASGAYYMAAAADEIYADPASIVGSIGVIFGGFGLDKALEKLSVDWRLQTAGTNKAMLDPFEPENPLHVEMMQTMLDDIHQLFITAVEDGRGDKLAEDDELFTGRFWSGNQAKKLGLIDNFGSVESVLSDRLDGIEAINYSIDQPWINQFVKASISSIQQSISTSWGAKTTPGIAAKLP